MKTVKTPPSLKWLINQKARLLGELIKLEASGPRNIIETDQLVKDAEKHLKLMQTRHTCNQMLMTQVVAKIKENLLAIETALSMHVIEFDQNLISPVKVQEKSRLLTHGAITRSIYECLKITGKPTTPTEVTFFIINRYQLNIVDNGFAELRRVVRKRMGYLGWENKLVRLHPARTSLEGKWILPKDKI